MKMVEVIFSALFIENPILDWPTNLATCIKYLELFTMKKYNLDVYRK